MKARTGERFLISLSGTLKLSQSGTWWHNGTPFTNRRLITLFNRSITWDENQRAYFLQIGKGRASFDVEDTAWFVSELVDSEVPWKIRLSDDSIEPLQSDTLCIGDQGQIYCGVKETHLARFSRSAHQALLGYAVDEHSIDVAGKTVRLQMVDKDSI